VVSVYQADDDPIRIDLDAVCAFLTTEPYWGRWRTEDIIVGACAVMIRRRPA
jgi:hypothetical protein